MYLAEYLIRMDIAKPTFYSRSFIAIYSLFMTPIGGAILLSINLKNTDKRKYIPLVLAGSLLFEAIHIMLIRRFEPVGSGLLFGPLLLGALILAFPLWHFLLDGLMFYESKPIWKPLIVMILVWSAFAGGIYAHIF